MTSSNSVNNEFCDLQHLGVLEVIGARASEFLQGQLTCDLREVNTKKMQPGAFCGVNGRILALLDVVDWQGLHLILPNDLCDPTQASLGKAALFSQVKITLSNKWRVLGLRIHSPTGLMPFGLSRPSELNEVNSGNGLCCYRIHGDLYMLLVDISVYNQLITWLSAAGWQVMDSVSWHVLQLQAGRASIYPESRGLFFPHRIGLQHNGYISFNKGCYRGQEIIARMHYRAQLKHELRVIHMGSAAAIAPGRSIISPVTRDRIGEIIDSCLLPSNKYCVMISVLRDHSGPVLLADVSV